MKLEGKVAVVTGSSKGIGKAIALRLVKDGAKVVINSRHQEDVDAVVKEIGKTGGNVYAIVADISKQEDIERLIADAVEHFGRIDIFVNNAGVLDRSSIADMDKEMLDRVIDINLKGTFMCMQAAARQMMEQGDGGNIVNISSIAGIRAFPQMSHYCMSKAGIIQMTRSAALELAPHKIKVNCIGPGAISTDMTKQIEDDPKLMKQTISHIPLGRIGEPDDIAGAVSFFVSEDSSYITGQTIFVDGGYVLM